MGGTSPRQDAQESAISQGHPAQPSKHHPTLTMACRSPGPFLMYMPFSHSGRRPVMRAGTSSAGARTVAPYAARRAAPLGQEGGGIASSASLPLVLGSVSMLCATLHRTPAAPSGADEAQGRSPRGWGVTAKRRPLPPGAGAAFAPAGRAALDIPMYIDCMEACRLQLRAQSEAGEACVWRSFMDSPASQDRKFMVLSRLQVCGYRIVWIIGRQELNRLNNSVRNGVRAAQAGLVTLHPRLRALDEVLPE